MQDERGASASEIHVTSPDNENIEGGDTISLMKFSSGSLRFSRHMEEKRGTVETQQRLGCHPGALCSPDKRDNAR